MDETERRIRAARPVSGNRHLPLTDRAKRELAELMIAANDTPSDPAARGRRGAGSRLRRMSLVAALVIVATALSVWWPRTSTPALAATPPVLEVTPLDEPGSLVLAQIAHAARESQDPPVTGDVTIRMQNWVLAAQMVDGEVDLSATVVSPENYVITIRSDGSQSIVVRAGEPLATPGSRSDVGPAPGTMLWSMDYPPEENQPLFSDAAPRRSRDVGPFLTAGSGLDTEASASNTMTAISYLLMEQRLDGEQRAALMEFVATLPDVDVAGATTDRLGRPAVVLTAPRPHADYTDYLLIDRSNGLVLATETTFAGTDRPDISTPAVTEYYAWEGS